MLTNNFLLREGGYDKIEYMVFLWDYDIGELKKTEAGRIFILERMINNGIYLKDKEKISISQVKKYWNKLHLEPKRKKYFQFLIWGK